MSEDDRYFVVNPALLEALTPAVRESLRRKAVGRVAEPFGEEEVIEEVAAIAIRFIYFDDKNLSKLMLGDSLLNEFSPFASKSMLFTNVLVRYCKC